MSGMGFGGMDAMMSQESRNLWATVRTLLSQIDERDKRLAELEKPCEWVACSPKELVGHIKSISHDEGRYERADAPPKHCPECGRIVKVKP